MENGEVVIMSAGTGNPFFTTRYRLFTTRYRNRGRCHAERYPRGMVSILPTRKKTPRQPSLTILPMTKSCAAVLKVMGPHRNLHVQGNNLPIIVFDMDTLGNLKKVMTGESIGTLVHN